MYKGNGLGIWVGFEGLFKLVRIDDIAPFVFNHDGCGATTLNIFLHATTEHTVLADDDLVAWLNHVYKTGFHAGRAWRRDRQGQFVFGLEGILQQTFDLFHHADENGIQMANSGTRKSLEDTRINIRWARAH